ncbi:DUF3450 family protein [Luteolibacter sp. AS25]|uniref:DUF3450 family protein n=1 Tax=Luteolibacter sp. AS25 TaxID=3135776 RepID=UPI00398AD3FB
MSTIAAELRLILNKKFMHRYAIIFLVLVTGLQAQTTDPAVVELRETISKIVDTQTLESKERIDWEVRKAEMDELLKLHAQELKLLNEEMDEAGNSAQGHLESTEELQADVAALKATRSVMAEAISRNVPRTLALAKSFPGPLVNESEEDLAKLKSWKPSDEPREVLRSMLSLLGKAHDFNRRYNRSTEIHDSRQVQVLYLGLARAFYTDGKSSSGIGQPGPDGWVWTPQPEIKGELLKAFETLEKTRPPSMVELPLKLD